MACYLYLFAQFRSCRTDFSLFCLSLGSSFSLHKGYCNITNQQLHTSVLVISMLSPLFIRHFGLGVTSFSLMFIALFGTTHLALQ
ncbi:hypothetical protein GCK32_012944 [Trichostrongylus colubriformis]|uniref:Uncharacterized protein n=1 Tax=Trichostrongylus colubriformis TaxID=6319 RepID=A0AAN8FEL1_TRICO